MAGKWFCFKGKPCGWEGAGYALSPGDPAPGGLERCPQIHGVWCGAAAEPRPWQCPRPDTASRALGQWGWVGCHQGHHRQGVRSVPGGQMSLSGQPEVKVSPVPAQFWAIGSIPTRDSVSLCRDDDGETLKQSCPSAGGSGWGGGISTGSQLPYEAWAWQRGCVGVERAEDARNILLLAFVATSWSPSILVFVLEGAKSSSFLQPLHPRLILTDHLDEASPSI